MNTVVLLALSLTTAGFVCFYLSCAHQRWRAAPWPTRPARAAASVLSLAGLYLGTRAIELVPAVFAFVVWVMLLLIAVPYLSAAWSARER